VISHRARPLVRGLPFFLCGICLSFGEAPFQFADILVAGILLFLSLFVFSFLVFHKNGWLNYRYRWVIGVVVFSTLLLLGVFIGMLSDHRISRHHFTHHNQQAILVRMEESVVQKGKSFRTVGRILAMATQDTWKPATGKILIYFPAEKKITLPEIGDRLLVTTPISILPLMQNPGQFDFTAWLERKQIYASVYLKENGWYQLPDIECKDWDYRLSSFRNKLMNSFYQAGLRGNNAGVVAALVMGDDTEVDADLMHAFSASGTLHILSVSGMHVALVYSVIAAFLGLLFRHKKYRWWKLTLILISLWSYAILTGCSPAVQRAAAMLSLVVTGKTISRITDTWNLLAGSLFILVGLQPQLLFESGFQLSYAAVAGIVGFYPWLYQRVTPSGRVGDLIWKSVCVAMSAQLFTFPLGLYYFHQFPNYFLPANLLIIPISTVVMFGGIGLLISSPVTPLFDLLAGPVRFLAQLLSQTVFLFEELPHAQLTGIWVSRLECLLLTTSIILATFFLVRRRNQYLFYTILVLSVFIFSQIVKYYVQSDRILCIQWKLPEKMEVISVVYGNRSVTWSNVTLHQRAQQTIHDGLDALTVSIQYRSFTSNTACVVPSNVAIPIFSVRKIICLPDTMLSMKSRSRPYGIIQLR